MKKYLIKASDNSMLVVNHWLDMMDATATLLDEGLGVSIKVIDENAEADNLKVWQRASGRYWMRYTETTPWRGMSVRWPACQIWSSTMTSLASCT